MIKIGVRLTNGEAKVEEFPNLGGNPPGEKAIASPHPSDLILLQSLIGKHTQAYNTATRIVANMDHNSKVYGDKVSDREWTTAKQYITRNEPLALEEKRAITFIKWIWTEIERGRVKVLKYQITPGAHATSSREIQAEGLMNRAQLIEAIVEIVYNTSAKRLVP